VRSKVATEMDGRMMSDSDIPRDQGSDLAKPLDDMSREELLELARSQLEGGIHITFSGKDNARRLARQVKPRMARGLAKYSSGTQEEQSRNQVIEGENLQAMVTLYRERGQVDLILTDPPYNTGRDFRYNDRWDNDPNDPDLGDFVSDEDGARHTKWMRFMWPRLRIMKDMLKPSGVLAICIDHRELFRLGAMLDELFHEENRLAVINWERSSTRRNDKSGVYTATEFILVYAKDRDRSDTALLERTAAMDAVYKNPDGDPEGPWVGVSPYAPGAPTHPGMVYGIQSPFTGELHYPTGTQCWANERPIIRRWLEAWGSEYVDRDLGDNLAKALVLRGAKDPRELANPLADDPVVARARRKAAAVSKKGPLPMLFFTYGGDGKPRKKTYIEKVKKGLVPSTYWADEDYESAIVLGSTSWDSPQSGTSETASRELAAIVGKHGFETVKPLLLFTKVIQLWCPPSGLVMDPFAGSGTTAHAVLQMNTDTGSTRRFIAIEKGRPEKGDTYARSLLAQRLKRVISGKWVNGKGTASGGGYRFVELQNTVDAKALLAMERDEMTDAVIASHYDANRRGGPGLILMTGEGYEYLVARDGSSDGFYLVWDGSAEPPVFDETAYEAMVKEAIKAGLRPQYHVYARFNLFQSDDVRFYQIPDQILLDFGLDINDPFNNPS
jgi:adenine-specific DNA-methyltransferase